MVLKLLTKLVINNKTGIKTVTLQKVTLSTILIFLQEHIKTPAVNQHYSYFINPNGLQHLIEVDELPYVLQTKIRFMLLIRLVVEILRASIILSQLIPNMGKCSLRNDFGLYNRVSTEHSRKPLVCP